MKKQYDVVALGELLIDFTSSGLSAQGNPVFEANPGGAPCNVLAMMAKLDNTGAFIGKLGDDMFGQMLKTSIADAGIDISGLVFDSAANTTMAFVNNKPDGDREFSFFRNPGADTRLSAEDLNIKLLQNCSIFHFGSLSLTHEPARAATQKAASLARESGAIISFDPNLRPPLWADMAEARRQMAWGCGQCDSLKIAEEELVFLSGQEGMAEGAAWLSETLPNIKIVFVTRGAKGAEAFWGGIHVAVPAFRMADTVDTTGAGDTFYGCCLSHMLSLDIGAPDKAELENMVRFANAAAALVTTQKGAQRAMPDRQAVLELSRREGD